MRFSKIFTRTLREPSKDAEIASHDLLLRAGFIRQLGAGIFSYMHLALRSVQKIKHILSDEMNQIGGVEISMPFVHPAELWKKTNRWFEIDESLVRFQDRGERDMVLAMTHEEVVAELTRTEISSYKQLPQLVYQIHDKFRDEARARGGLIRVREFIMKDSYSLDKDWEGLEKQYIAHYDAYFRMMARVALPVVAIQSDVGMMGGKVAHEFMYLSPIGEDTIFISPKTGYQANKEVANFKKIYAPAEPQALSKVHTPETSSIESLAALLRIEPSATAKAVFFIGTVDETEKLIFVVIRGDWEVNPVKVQKAGKIKNLRPAQAEEIAACGAVAGFASPIGIRREGVLVIVDDWVAESANLVAGANEKDYHYLNTCYGRDYTADIVADIAAAYEGALAPDAPTDHPDYAMKAYRGVEVGNIFQLGIKYTQGMGAMFTDENGKAQPVIMGSYGIGVGRLLACVAEEHCDEAGLKLPVSIAPYQVHLVGLLDNEEVIQKAEALYQSLTQAGVEVLYDDRDGKTATAGVKFSDADLIGLPIRLTLSKRSLANGGVELKLRREKENQMVGYDQVLTTVQRILKDLFAEISTGLAQAQTWEQRR